MSETEYNTRPGSSQVHELTPDEEVKQAGGNTELKEDKVLDGPEARGRLRRVQNWLSEEIEVQSGERNERLVDHEYYDSHQWDDDDAAEVEDRGQEAIVFNILKQSADALIGQHIQQGIDYQILPRTPDDVQGAEIKSKVFKYVMDVNSQYIHRTAAAKDQRISGLGWIDTGVRTDPTKETVYYKYEDWRNCWYDHLAQGPDYLDTGRFVFRLKWTDLDLASAMFPKRSGQILRSAGRTMEDYFGQGWSDDVFPFQGEDNYVPGSGIPAEDSNGLTPAGIGSYGLFGLSARRNRVLLGECQYKMRYQQVKILKGKALGTLENTIYDPQNPVEEIQWLIEQGYAGLVDAVTTVTRQMIFCGNYILQDGLIPYNHNRFSLVPIFAFRRKKTGEPYGYIRSLRGVQDDFNKRRSKSLYTLSSNKVIADDDATDDWDELHYEAQRPDGLIKKKRGSEVSIQNETALGVEHANMAQQDLNFMQQAGGVPQESQGLETNAQSGKAIDARANYGLTINSEFHQNQQFGDQQIGQNILSLIEQFMPNEKIVRLTQEDGTADFTTINQQQPDGSILNDITASQADFIVSTTPFSASERVKGHEALGQILANMQLPENVQLSILAMWAELSSVPAIQDKLAKILRQISGVDLRPESELTQEELAEKQASQQQQQQQAALQQKLQELELALKQAQANKQNADAGKSQAQSKELFAQIDLIYAQIQEIKDKMKDASEQTRIKKAQTLHQIENDNRQPIGGSTNG